MKVKFFDPIQKKTLEYHIDNYLKARWDNIKKNLVKKDQDKIFLCDGGERQGKSVFVMQQAKYLNHNFSIENVCFTPEEFLKQIKTAPKGSVIIFDEAFRGLSSKASQSKVNKAIVQAMMEMGQKNLIVFIVLPTFFLLEMYAACFRSVALFHIYKNKTKRHCFRIYNKNKKQVLYLIGKKKAFSYAKPLCRIRGTFTDYYTIDEQAYRKKKLESLMEFHDIKEDAKVEIVANKRITEEYKYTIGAFIDFLHSKLKKTYGEISIILKERGRDITPRGVGYIHSWFLTVKRGQSKEIEGKNPINM